MDRTRLQQLGLSAQNVGQNVLIALSGSSQTQPAFWLNPQNGADVRVAQVAGLGADDDLPTSDRAQAEVL